jgi:hypothetical protein
VQLNNQLTEMMAAVSQHLGEMHDADKTDGPSAEPSKPSTRTVTPAHGQSVCRSVNSRGEYLDRSEADVGLQVVGWARRRRIR